MAHEREAHARTRYGFTARMHMVTGVGRILVTRVRSKHAALTTNSAHIFYHLECAVPLKARCQQRSQSGATGRRTPWQLVR